MKAHLPDFPEDPVSQPCAPLGRVLVVDDTALNLRLADLLLGTAGYTVLPASSRAEALEMARRERPDLILSDLHMPGGDGLELLADLQADAALREVPFAILSASCLCEADRRRAVAQGAKAFIQRPIGAKALLAEVAALIEEARRSRSERS